MGRKYDGTYRKTPPENPTLAKRLKTLEQNWEGRTTYSADQVLHELEMFCLRNKTFPLESSLSLFERNLAVQVKSKKYRAFSETQLARVEELRRLYGPAGKISLPEKLIAFALEQAIGEERVQQNEKIAKHEADVTIRCSSGSFVVQYDGFKAHRLSATVNNDVKANAAHIAEGFKVIRLRDARLTQGSNPISTKESLSDEEKRQVCEIPIPVGEQCSIEDYKRAVNEILVIIDPTSSNEIDWKTVEIKARNKMGHRYATIDLIIRFARHILIEGQLPPAAYEKNNEIKEVVNVLRSRIRRKGFTLNELRFLSALEREYSKEGTGRQTKFTDAYKKLLNETQG